MRVLETVNRGVAAARNLAIEQARGTYVAPIDADDLWHPDKLARQMDAMKAGAGRIGLVYCGFRFIDGESRVIETVPFYPVDGWGLLRLLVHNVVGSGSAPLIRRDVLQAVGGYDETLRADQLGGAEDFLLQLKVAHRAPIAGVADYLVGYRTGGARMSSDIGRMLRSHVRAIERLRQAAPELPDWPVLGGDGFFEVRNGLRMMAFGSRRAGLAHVWRGLSKTFPAHWPLMLNLTVGWALTVLRRGRGPRAALKFETYGPEDPAGARTDPLLARILRKVARREGPFA